MFDFTLTDRGLTHFYAIVGILVTLTAPLIISSAVRSWLFLKSTSWRFRNKDKFNARIQKQIDTVKDLSAAPQKALAYFFEKGFLLALLLVVMLLFSIPILFRVNVIGFGAGFVALWLMFVRVVTDALDVATRLRNTEKSLEWLEKRKKL